MVDFDTNEAKILRRRMIETQLKARGINDRKVLNAFEQVERHRFAPFNSLEEAYADNPSSIDCKQTISQPYMVALMTQELDLKPNHQILEIGTGSGYQTAILCKICEFVCSIERHESLAEKAKATLTAHHIINFQITVGDGSQGLPDEAPFDRIIVTAAAETFPPALLAQLSSQEGVMVIPKTVVKDQQELFKVVRHSQTHYEYHRLGSVRFVPLVVDSV